MDWEFWTKELDAEVLVENGGFCTQEEFVGVLCLQLLIFLFCCSIKSALCSHAVIHEMFKRG